MQSVVSGDPRLNDIFNSTIRLLADEFDELMAVNLRRFVLNLFSDRFEQPSIARIFAVVQREVSATT